MKGINIPKEQMSMTSWRPDSLAEVARRAASGESFDMSVREFVDTYQSAAVEQRYAMLIEEPHVTTDAPPIRKAFLGGLAEYYSRHLKKDPPAWCLREDCFLKRPHFCSPLESLKAYLLLASPSEFRKRLIFTDTNPVPRPPRTLSGEDPTEEEMKGRRRRMIGTIRIS